MRESESEWRNEWGRGKKEWADYFSCSLSLDNQVRTDGRWSVEGSFIFRVLESWPYTVYHKGDSGELACVYLLVDESEGRRTQEGNQSLSPYFVYTLLLDMCGGFLAGVNQKICLICTTSESRVNGSKIEWELSEMWERWPNTQHWLTLVVRIISASVTEMNDWMTRQSTRTLTIMMMGWRGVSEAKNCSGSQQQAYVKRVGGWGFVS